MPRGMMLHTKLVKEAKEVAVVKLAERIAQLKIEKKKPADLSMREHFGTLIDGMNIRDIIYLLSYCAAVKLFYDIQVTIGERLDVDKFTSKVLAYAYPTEVKTEEKEEPKGFLDDIDINILLRSMVLAYGVLKVDFSDVAGAVTKLGSLISGAVTTGV